MANKPKTIVYSEPESYFPKSIRKKYKIGEYAETNTKSKPAKSSKKK